MTEIPVEDTAAHPFAPLPAYEREIERLRADLRTLNQSVHDHIDTNDRQRRVIVKGWREVAAIITQQREEIETQHAEIESQKSVINYQATQIAIFQDAISKWHIESADQDRVIARLLNGWHADDLQWVRPDGRGYEEVQWMSDGEAAIIRQHQEKTT